MTLRMEDEPRFSAKWDFRRQENNFDDSSSDDPDSNSTHDPIIENPNLVLHSNQLDNGKTAVTREQTLETQKRRSKKDESQPEKAKQVRRRKPNIVCAEKSRNKEETVMENKKTEETLMENKKIEETLMEKKKIEETVIETGDVGMFMKTLLDDLKASRESLMDWMSTELYGSSDQNFASRAHLKKRAAAVGVAAQRSVKKRRAKKKIEEEEKKESEKQSKHSEISQEMNRPKETSLEIVQNGGEQVHELDYNAGTLDMFLKSGQGGLGRNYFQQPEQGQEGTVTNQKSVVLAIKAPKLSQREKKTREADTIMNISSMVERTLTGSETQKYDDNFAIPFAPKLSSSPSSLQSFPLGSLNSLFSSSSQGITSLTSNNNFQQPVVSQLPDLSEFQTGFTGGQGFGNSLFRDNSYFSGFPAAFQPNLIAGGYDFTAQMNPATSSQQRDHNNVFGGLKMAGGAIRYSGNRFSEPEVGNGNNSFSDYRTGSAGR